MIRSFTISSLLLFTVAVGAAVACWCDRPRTDLGWNVSILPYSPHSVPEAFADRGRKPPRLGAMRNGEDLRGIEYQNGAHLYRHGHELGFRIAIEEFIGQYYYARIPRNRKFELPSNDWNYDHFEYARQLGHVDGEGEIERLLKTYNNGDELRGDLSQSPPNWSQRRLLFLSVSILFFGFAFYLRNPRQETIVG